MGVSVNPPKTPVTEGCKSTAAATLPNVCKMPGPPAPFVPTPLPNIAKSGRSPKGYSKNVKVEGKAVAIKGASFESMGDVPSKGTGGGLVSANTCGPIKFIGPGSMDVKFEGKNVQLLGDPVLNNCGPSGSPSNSATMMGTIHEDGSFSVVTGEDACPICKENHGSLKEDKKTTKGDAKELATNLIEKSTFRGKTMLAVVRCQCNQTKKRYASMSASSVLAFDTAATKMITEKFGANSDEQDDPWDLRGRMQAIFRRNKNRKVKSFSHLWKKAMARYDLYKSQPAKNIAAHPPGQCAGPRALLLCREHGGLPLAMTEQLYSPKFKVTKPVQYIDLRVSNKPITRSFKHGETVPPCKTCEVVLPLLLCTEGKSKCSHKKRS